MYVATFRGAGLENERHRSVTFQVDRDDPDEALQAILVHLRSFVVTFSGEDYGHNTLILSGIMEVVYVAN